ncbi:MAG: transposase [Mollicutes bacterium UO1]
MAQVAPDTKRSSLEPLIRKHVEKGSNVYTDECHAYKDLGKKGYKHETVNHRIKQYVITMLELNVSKILFYYFI